MCHISDLSASTVRAIRLTQSVPGIMADPISPAQSLTVRKHLPILKALLAEKGIRQAEVAKRLGLASPSAAGMKLRGERGMERRELEIMCEMAGITIVALAAMSDDLILAKRATTVEGAAILDELDPTDLEYVMGQLRLLKSKAR